MKVRMGIGACLLFILMSTPVMGAKEKITLAWRDTTSELKALKNTAEAFERKYGIEVKITPFAWGDGDNKVFTMFASGISPDLFASVYRSGIVDYVKRGLCTDLTPYIKRDKVDLGRFYPNTLKHLKIEGKQMSLPDHGGVTCMWYNPNLFDQVGIKAPPSNWADESWTWDEMVSVSQKLTRDTNGDGKPDTYALTMDFWPISTTAWLWGGDFFPESIYDSGVAKKSAVTSPAAVTAITKLAELYNRYKIIGTADGFVRGKIAMQVNGSWNLEDCVNTKGTLVKPSACVFPKGTAPRRPTIFTNPWLISKNSKHKEAAWKWIKFCTLEEGADILTRQYRFPILNKKGVAEHMKLYDKIPNYQKVFESALDIGQESPNHTLANFGEILLAIEDEVNKALRGQVSAAQAMKNLEPKLDSILTRTYNRFSTKK